MATINLYNIETNRFFYVKIKIGFAIVDTTVNGDYDFFLEIKTNIPKLDGSNYPVFMVKTTTDTPPGYGNANGFKQLCEMYMEYFTQNSGLDMMIVGEDFVVGGWPFVT